MKNRDNTSQENVTIQNYIDGRKPQRERPENAPSFDIVELMQDILVDGTTYELLLSRMGEDQAAEYSLDAIEHFVQRMEPESPAEKLLASQMLLQHAHIILLLRRLHTGADARDVGSISGAINAAMDVFRRQTEAWNRIRRPQVTVQAIQANMAYQQLIGTGGPTNDVERATGKSSRNEPAPTLSAESRGIGVPSSVDPRDQALAGEHWTANRKGEAK